MDLGFVSRYFDAERAESLLFITVGVLAIACAAWRLLQHPGPLSRGLAWPLVLVALIQLSVGVGIYLRSPKDIARVETLLREAPARIASEELPRMEKVMRNFVLYRGLEAALLAIGLGLAFVAPAGSLWRGVGLGLAPQSGLMLALDFFAEARGASYLAALRALTSP